MSDPRKRLKEYCPHCGRRMTVGVKRFDGFTASMFVSACKRARDKEVVWNADRANPNSKEKKAFMEGVIEAKDMIRDGNGSRYARFSDLKFWGLLNQCPDHWHQGVYQITPMAWKFLMGKARIPKRLKVVGGKVYEASKETVDLETALGDKWNEVGDWISDWRQTNPNLGNETRG